MALTLPGCGDAYAQAYGLVVYPYGLVVYPYGLVVYLYGLLEYSYGLVVCPHLVCQDIKPGALAVSKTVQTWDVTSATSMPTSL